MNKYGLIGYPLSHSFSQKFFTDFFQKNNLHGYSYELFAMENLSDFRNWIAKNPELCGLNVTIPHKINILPFLDKTDEKAKEIGAVNTLKILRDANKIILEGFNTDESGFSMAIKPLLKANHHRALIFGNGGSSKTVQFVLKRLGISFFVVTRNPVSANEISYSELNKNYIQAHPLLINTTPLGMFPKTNEFPEIPYEYLTENHLLFDLIYNPEETEFLKKGKAKGALTSNGLSMLHQQALAAWEIWNR